MQWASAMPDQIGVEQRHHAADAGDAEPDRQELRPVGHQQADRVALGDALRQRPARVAVGAGAELAIAEASRGRRAAPARRRICRPAPRSPAETRGSDSWRYASCSAARAAQPPRQIRSAVSRSKNPMAFPDGGADALDATRPPRNHRLPADGGKGAIHQRSTPPNGISGLSTNAGAVRAVGRARG